MKNATAITVAGLLLGISVLSADEGLKTTDSVAMAGIQANPLMYLPGMAPITQPRLPAGAAALPSEVISQVTNYPNPFDSRKPGIEGQTVIAYSLGQDSKVTIELYDLLGHRVRQWSFPANAPGGRAGANQVGWDGTNEAGQKVSKGGYIAEIQVETSNTTATVIRKIGVIH